eukprot:5026425-Amphidinium_carterae.1
MENGLLMSAVEARLASDPIGVAGKLVDMLLLRVLESTRSTVLQASVSKEYFEYGLAEVRSITRDKWPQN